MTVILNHVTVILAIKYTMWKQTPNDCKNVLFEGKINLKGKI